MDARWRQTLIVHAAFIAQCVGTGKEISALFSLPGFLLSYVTIDLMHASDLGEIEDEVVPVGIRVKAKCKFK